MDEAPQKILLHAAGGAVDLVLDELFEKHRKLTLPAHALALRQKHVVRQDLAKRWLGNTACRLLLRLVPHGAHAAELRTVAPEDKKRRPPGLERLFDGDEDRLEKHRRVYNAGELALGFLKKLLEHLLLLREQPAREIADELAERLKQHQDQKRRDERIEKKQARAVLYPGDKKRIDERHRERHRDKDQEARKQGSEVEQPLL